MYYTKPDNHQNPTQTHTYHHFEKQESGVGAKSCQQRESQLHNIHPAKAQGKRMKTI